MKTLALITSLLILSIGIGNSQQVLFEVEGISNSIFDKTITYDKASFRDQVTIEGTNTLFETDGPAFFYNDIVSNPLGVTWIQNDATFDKSLTFPRKNDPTNLSNGNTPLPMCDSTKRGNVAFDNSDGKFKGCDGVTWVVFNP